MRRISLVGLTLVSAALFFFLGCGGGYSGSNYGSGAGGTNSIVTNIVVTPASAGISIGGTQQFMAKATDSSGNAVANPQLTWHSSDPTVATISSTGLATGVAAGSSNITASITYTSGGVYTTGPGTTYTSNVAVLNVTMVDAVAGTAAVGHALAGALITLKDADGRTQTAMSGDDGRFMLSTAGLKAPFLLKADDGRGQVLFGAAAQSGMVANLDTVTDLMLRAWYGAHGSTPEAAFADMRAHPAPDQKSLLALDRNFHAVLRDSLRAEGLPADKFNLFSTSFQADSTGFDAVLDNLHAVTAGRLELQDGLMGRSTDVSGLGR
ncbi:MAG TPA: Ig-like domain-containing protein [Gammaproteobacteria bacterium]|jgi:hypothetical protein